MDCGNLECHIGGTPDDQVIIRVTVNNVVYHMPVTKVRDGNSYGLPGSQVLFIDDINHDPADE